MKLENRKRLLIDFDGVIHKYSKGYFDGTCYDEPMEKSFEKLQILYDQGFELYVFSARCESEEGVEAIKRWFSFHSVESTFENWRTWVFIEKLKYTNKKLPALAYIDDRGIRFTNWEDIVKYFI